MNDPEAVRRVLLDNAANYQKPRLLRRIAPLLADGLFGAEGAEWRGQRRLMAPVFTPGATQEFLPIFTAVARETADGWAAQAPGVIDVAAGATRATFDVISRALFSAEHGLTGDEAARHVAALLAQAGQAGLLALTGLSRFDPSPAARTGRRGEAFSPGGWPLSSRRARPILPRPPTS